jgi:hypothetical protein
MKSRRNTRRQHLSPIGRRLQARRSKSDEPVRSRERIDEYLDESLEESFPASDPPSWTVLTKIGSPR